MSYVRHKSRAFRDAGDIPELVRRRSEGRLKTYPSTEDARAWCGITDERRQQILDHVMSDIEKCSVGKYVPIDVLINTLLANKNSDCGKLREQLEELQKLLDVYSQLELTEEQKAQLQGMKQRLTKPKTSLGALAGRSGTPSTASGKTASGRRPKSDSECRAIKREQEGIRCSATDVVDDRDLKSTDDKDLRALLKKKDAEIDALKKLLAAKQTELDQVTSGKSQPGAGGLKDIEKERDSLKKELQASKHEIQTLKSRIDEPCMQEIEGLENEIQRLKSKGQLSADEEAEIIRKEIEVLKKYCAKLAAIQEENQALKLQLDSRKGGATADSSVPADIDIDALRRELDSKMAKLNEVMNERDKLKERSKVLEKELIKYQDLPEDIETMKRKSQMLDSVSEECKKLRTSLEGMKTVENELQSLKKKADKADELQKKLASTNEELTNVRNQSAAAIETLKSKNDEILKERQNYKKVAMEARNMGEELKCLAHCAKEAEALKRERDILKSKLNKLSGIEMQYKQLQEKVKYLENIKSEREMYKMKYEEMLGLECDCEMLKAQVDKFKCMDKERQILLNQVRDCECCIAEQEEEIKKLIAYIDNLSRGNTEQQVRTQKEKNNLRNELNQKNSLIEATEHQLCCVQGQLKKIIKSVAYETCCLKNRIIDLEERLTGKRKGGSSELNEEGDEHYQEMLIQSNCAVQRILEDLEKQLNGEEDLVRLSAENETLKKVSVEAQKSSTNANDDVVVKYEEAKIKIANLEKQLAECKARSSEDLERLNAENTTLKRLSTDDSQAKAKIAELETQLADCRENVQRVNAEVSTLKELALNNDANEKYEEQKRINNELEEQLKQCKITVSELQNSAQAELQRLNAENNSLKTVSMHLQNTANDSIEDANKRISRLESDLKAVKEERDQLNNLVRQYKENETINRVQTTQSTQEGDYDQLAAELKICKKELKRRQEQDCAFKRGKSSDDELRKCREERNRLLAQIEDQKKQINSLMEGVSPDFAKEMKEKEDMQNLIRQLQDQLAAMEKGAPMVDNAALERLRAQLELEQKRAQAAEQQLKQVCAEQGVAVPPPKEIEKSDIRRISQAYEEKLGQSKLQLELANTEKKQKDQEIKGLHTKYNEGIAKLQTSHEEILKEVDKEHEKELDNLRSELRRSKETIDAYKKQIESTAPAPAAAEKPVSEKPTVPSAAEKPISKVASEKLEPVSKAESEKPVTKTEVERPTPVTKEETPTAKAEVERPTPASTVESEKPTPASTVESEKPAAVSKAESETPAPVSKPESEKPADVPKAEGNQPAAVPKTEGDKPAPPTIAEGEKPTVSKAEDEKPAAVSKGEAEKPAAVTKGEAEKIAAVSKGEAEKPAAISKAEADKPAAVSKAEAEKSTPDSAKPAPVGKPEDEKPTPDSAKPAPAGKPEAEKSTPDSAKPAPAGKPEAEKPTPDSAKPAPAGKPEAEKPTPGEKPTLAAEGETPTPAAKVKSETLTPAKKVDSVKSAPVTKVASDKITPATKAASETPISKLESKVLSEKLEPSEKAESEKSPAASKVTSEKTVTDERKGVEKVVSDQKPASEPTSKEEVSIYEKPSEELIASEKEVSEEEEGYLIEMETGEVPTKDKPLMKKPITTDAAGRQIVPDKVQPRKPGEPETKLRPSQGTMVSPQKPILSSETQDTVSIPPVDKINAETTPSMQVCRCGPALHGIIQKLVRFGLESLNFEELKLLHNKTCEATAALLRKYPHPNRNVQFTPESNPNDDDRQRLIKRITSLENDLLKKQKQTHDKVGALQIAVKMERQRLQDFKDLLETEKSKNNELMVKIGAQSRTVASMQAEREVMLKKSSFNEEKLQSLILHCKHEKMRIQKLEQELEKEKMLHKEKVRAYHNQVRGAQMPYPSCNCPNKSHDLPEVEVKLYATENKDNRTFGDQTKNTNRRNRNSKQRNLSDLDELD